MLELWPDRSYTPSGTLFACAQGVWKNRSHMSIGGIVVYSLLALVMLLVPAFVGAYLARNRGRSGLVGALLGFFLGWIGVVIVLLLSDQRGASPQIGGPRGAANMYRECPHCKEQMRRDASVCPHCRLQSTPQTIESGSLGSVSGLRSVGGSKPRGIRVLEIAGLSFSLVAFL